MDNTEYTQEERELMNSPIFEERVNQDRSVDMSFDRLSPINPPMTQEELANLDSFEFGKGTPLEGVAFAKPKASKPKKKLTVKLKKKKPAASSSKKKGGKRKSRRKRKKKYTKKNFKKHYMWNTRGKRYFAKTYKQHRRGIKLGHTHKKPKKTRR